MNIFNKPRSIRFNERNIMIKFSEFGHLLVAH